MPATPNGAEFPVNTVTLGDQITYAPLAEDRMVRAVATDAAGNFVVVWSSQGEDDPDDSTGYGVYAQLYNSAGVAQGAAISVNAAHTTSRNQYAASVAMDTDGDFVVTWSSNDYGQSGDSDQFGVFAQRYDEAGVAQGATITVNETTARSQQHSSITTLENGDFIITWTGAKSEEGTNIYARRFNSAGVAQGGEILVNTATAGDQLSSSVAVDPVEGRFVVVWESADQDGSGLNVYAQLFNANGSKLGSEFRVNTFTASSQKNASVAMDQNGNFVITWSSNGVDGKDGSDWGVYARRFAIDDSAATKRIEKDAADVLVNKTTFQAQQYSSVAMDADGNYVISWTGVDDGAGQNDVYYKRYYASGLGVEGDLEFQVNNTVTANNQELSTVAVDGNGNFIIAWTSELQDGSGAGVFAQRYNSIVPGNNPPTDIGLTANTVNENAATNTVIGELSTVDADATDTHTYTLVSGGDIFKIVEVSGKYQLQVKDGSLLDFETEPTVTVQIQTDDGRGGKWTESIDITVNNVNERPTDISLTNTQIAENSPSGTLIDIISGTDPENSSTLTFELAVGVADNAKFAIVKNGSNYELRTNGVFDYENDADKEHTIRIVAKDPDGLTYEEDILITVNNANDAPTGLALDNSIVFEGTIEVGNFTTTDSDTGDTHQYTLIAGGLNNNLFEIVGGELRFKTSPTKGDYQIKVRTTDQNGTGQSYDADFTVKVKDVNAAPTDLTLSNSQVGEGVIAVGAFTTTDPDNPDDVHKYSFVDEPGLNNNLFEIIGGNQLRFKAAPTPGSYKIKVNTTDLNGTGFSYAEEFTITVDDVNDAPTDITLSNSSVNERVQDVGAFSTTDPDAGDTHLYSFVDEVGLNNNLFEFVDGNKLHFKAPPAPGTYTIKVRTTDLNGTGLSYDESFTITVGNVNDAPTDITLSNNSVNERVQDVGSFSTTDPDAGDTHLYSFVDEVGLNNDLFEFVDGNKLHFKAAPAPGTYTIKVRTTDLNGTGLSYDESFTITVGNVNDAPTDITLSNSSVNERVQDVGTFSTTDPDAGDTHLYSFVDEAGLNNDLFEFVDGNKLHFKAPPAPGSYTIKVRTTDLNGTGLSYDESFTITVSDTNDKPIALKLVDDLNADVSLINENVTNLKVGTLKTTDPDAIDNHTYSFIGGLPDNSAFTLSGDKLFFKNSPNYETQDEYTIKVRTTDKGGLTFDQVFILKITDINEAPVVSPADGTITYAENSAAIAIAADLQVSDPDQSQLTEATVTLNGYVAGQDELRFTNQAGITGTFDEATRTLKLAGLASVDAYRTALRSITYINTSGSPNTIDRTVQISVKDEGGLSSNLATRTLQITSINGAPAVTTTGGTLTYNENAGALAIDPAITVSDQDSGFLTESTIEIVGYVANQDQLTFNSVGLGINSVFDTAKGILRLSGKASIANYQTALSAVTYTHNSDNPGNTTRTIQFTVKDDGTPGLASPVATRTIQLLPANDAPVVTSSGTLSYTENAGAVAINPSLNVVDADSANLTGATIVLTGYVANQDQLGFTNQNGITGKLSQAGNTLTLALSGNASVAQYQQALRSITYTNSSEIPNPANRTVSMTVTDGVATSNVGTRTIEVRSINDPPVVTASVSSVVFPKTDGAIAIDPGLDLQDVDSAQLTEATIVLTGYIAGEDRLLFTDQNGITGSFNGATGVLKLEGSAAVTDYQAALRSVIYTNTSNTPKNTPRTVEINATDGIARSNTVKVEIRFDKDTSLPVLDLNGGGGGIDFSSTFVIKGSAVSIVASGASLTDPDSKNLTSARVSIANLLDGQNEELLIDTQGTGITAFYNREQGTLSLQGTASITTYLNVLRSIKYQNHSTNPDRTTRTILFQVSDGVGQSDPAQAIVQITKVNLLTQGTTGQDSLETTPATDLIDAQTGDDTLASILEYLQQNDQIDGGGGNDTFILKDGAGAAVVDVSNSMNQIGGILTGNTTVRNFEYFDFSSFKGSAAMTGHDGLNDRLTSGAGNDTILGVAGNDALSGNAGKDYLDGGTGIDTLIGGSGDDTYVVDQAGDQIIEEAGVGYELILASTNWTLGEQLDDLTLTGRAIVGTGNDLNNAITGNQIGNALTGNAGNDILIGLGGRDTLVGGNGRDLLQGGNGNDRIDGGKDNDQVDGGAGKDLLWGGKGKDRFLIARPRKSNLDTLKDFNSADDTIQVSRQGFSRELKRGKITASQFVLGSRARDQSDRFIYDQSTGALFFDRDGIGGAGQVQFAKLSNRVAIGRSDISAIQ